MFWLRLTKWMSGDHPLGVDGLGDAKPVLCTDSEAILFTSCQFGNPKAGFGARCGHSDPVALADITLLQNVVGDVAAAILLWGVPEQRAAIDVQFGDFKRSFRGSGDVYRDTEDESLKIATIDVHTLSSVCHCYYSSFTI